MKVVIGSDHAGFETKTEIIKFLKGKNIDVIDVGTNSLDSCDYPIFGHKIGEAIAKKEADFGVAICHTGEGIMMSVNKIKGVRCGMGYNDDVAKLMREHNDAQVIAFGAKEMELEDIKRRLDIFLSTPFSYGERHLRRLNLIEK